MELEIQVLDSFHEKPCHLQLDHYIFQNFEHYR